jgi:immune inhibitor A
MATTDGTAGAHRSAVHTSERCLVAPHPDLRDRMVASLERLRSTEGAVPSSFIRAQEPTAPGLNDGLIIPGSYFPVGTSLEKVRSAASDRAPLRGALQVIVVLAEFDDQPMTADVGHFEELFFSTGALPDGSVREYYQDVTHGLIDIQGRVVGPYRLPQTMAAYANGAAGIGSAPPNARTMARDAAVASDPDVDFKPFDNDGNGFVDAFIVLHAGPGGEVTGNAGHIWSHKWVLSGGEYAADSAKIFAYLTVPEDSRIGVCCHELGHLLFGWPDLYDIDNSSSGLGDWCLMAGGSWNGNGDVPAHPSAWCKVDQGWVTVGNQSSNGPADVGDVKETQNVIRLWQDGAAGAEYFLVENRQRKGFDRDLPGDGLLVYHIDDSVQTNANESHYKVGLIQADAARGLELGVDRGDGGDPYPGSAGNMALTTTSTPNSHSYGGLDTCVGITGIGASASIMRMDLTVSCAAPPPVDEPTLRRGSSGEAVSRLQQNLVDLGFEPGPVDGLFGPLTEGAVRDFQTSRGIVVDGIVGPQTWATIHADLG